MLYHQFISLNFMLRISFYFSQNIISWQSNQSLKIWRNLHQKKAAFQALTILQRHFWKISICPI